MAAEFQFQRQRKRLILCCDGTWMDSDDGYTKPTLIPYNPTAVLQVPSNITRISHALKRHGHDGMPQIIYYHSGVGTGTSIIDNITGGLLGTGISENIREGYAFIANNYTPGDEIILIGFSRGAFTVRSVAGMVRDIGLLTLQGMDSFYPIFKDQENFRNKGYKDIFPDLPFPDKPRDEAGYDQKRYKKKLVDRGLTRVYDPNGRKIQIQAVAVFDTVGSLGIPNTSFLSKLGLPHSTKEFKFYDTNLSGTIRHAFQALALDEHRRPFAPAVWERRDNVLTDLRQVWFPGAHSNIGGGYDDQEIANVTLTWMMDQLASIGVAFKDNYVDKIFDQNVQYYENALQKPTSILSMKRRQTQWAVTPVYEMHKPVRPWGLGEIYESETGIWHLAGKQVRTPGRYMRPNPDTGLPSRHRLANTNERIHSSVRIRLDLDGLDLDDKGLYQCSALLKSRMWELRKARIKVQDAIPSTASWGRNAPPAAERDDDIRWIWEYVGPEETAPKVRIMIEENLGPYERQLLSLNKGNEVFPKATGISGDDREGHEIFDQVA
ncbi:putative peptidoglycan binding containing protein [Coleophoma cylindrospora]|uniref:Putative peptidoglycan binding containing protein n=1 Tax=Coleophoma cylindrospora TaxID=1849047 RepID=A0A3D8SE24_9HELO|nr:putative peptidoglycan binding containing protein [Coleophoma cylindrospora]